MGYAESCCSSSKRPTTAPKIDCRMLACYHVHETTPSYTMMQQKSAVECSHGDRLKRLRAKLQVEWADLANRLDLSTSMCFQVAKGAKNLSDLALFRLEDAERAAGILPPKPPIDVVKVAEEPPAQKDEIVSNREELRAIAIELRDLCARINRLEERMNK